MANLTTRIALGVGWCNCTWLKDGDIHSISCPQQQVLYTADVIRKAEDLAYKRGWSDATKKVAYEINIFQDIDGWKKGDSRNKLIGDIAHKINNLGHGDG